jgi:hypothetical protein
VNFTFASGAAPSGVATKGGPGASAKRSVNCAGVSGSEGVGGDSAAAVAVGARAAAGTIRSSWPGGHGRVL